MKKNDNTLIVFAAIGVLIRQVCVFVASDATAISALRVFERVAGYRITAADGQRQ